MLWISIYESLHANSSFIKVLSLPDSSNQFINTAALFLIYKHFYNVFNNCIFIIY